MSEKLMVSMFGGLNISYGNSSIENNGDCPSKEWNLIAYLIAYKNREISHGELFEILWEGDDELQNPTSALKTLVHRTRKTLGSLGLDGKDLIISKRGSYCWNTGDTEVYYDTDLFEGYYRKAEKKRFSNDSYPDLLSAAELYKGNFLPNHSTESWTIPLAVYYNNRYISVVYKALDILSFQKRYDDVIDLCRKALNIAPYNESLNIQLIDALVHRGHYQLALDQYNHVTEVLYQQFALTPSDEFQAMYREIVKKTNLKETCITEISENIKNGAPERGAYYCVPAVFQEICQYDSRTKMRSGGVSFLGLLTVHVGYENEHKSSDLDIAINGLKKSIHNSLRSGDCFAQLSTSQFGILLQNTTYEKGRMVLMRVIRAYYHQYPEMNIKIDQNLKQLDPFELQKVIQERHL